MRTVCPVCVHGVGVMDVLGVKALRLNLSKNWEELMRKSRDGTIFESFVSDSFRCITHKESTLIYSFLLDIYTGVYDG